MAKAYFKWKEQMVYEEGGQVLVFEAPMGVSPSDVYVPTAALWTTKVPPWARDKREEVLRAIRGVEGLGKVVETPDAWVEDHTW